MAITFIGSNTQDTGSGLSLTMPIPAGAQQDDFMVCFVKQSENTTQREWDDDGGGGNGWTRLAYNRTTGGRDQETAIYWKIHTGTESDPTFTWASGITAEPMSGTILVYRGVDTATPFTDWAFQWNQNDANPPNPSLTVSTTPATIVVFHAATHDDITTPAAPTGYTMRTQVWNGTSDDHRNHFTADFIGGVVTPGNYTPPDWQHAVANTTPEYHVYGLVLQEVQPIGVDSATPDPYAWGAQISITGFGFNALQEDGKVEIWSDVSGTTKVEQTIDSWSDTAITFTSVQGALSDDTTVYIVATNSDADESSPRPIDVGIQPYSNIIANQSPDHHWPLDGNYDDVVAGNDMTVNPVNGGGAFVASPICEDSTNAWRAQDSSREAPNSNAMNGQAEVDRMMGGWIRLGSVQKGLACLYEEGGGVNNIAFFTGMGNVLIAQQADTGDDNVQAYSDFKLAVDRNYHIAFRFSYTDGTPEFRLYIDGILQAVTSGNPLLATDLDGHSGDITFGGTGGNLEVAGTDVLFVRPEDCYYARWASWSTNKPASDILELFQRGALPTVVIATDTPANMQIALDALADTVRPDAPLAIRIQPPTGGGNLSLDADNITFDERVSIQVEWRGEGVLTWTNLNGSDLTASKAVATIGGTVTIVDPAILTLNGIEDGSEAVVYEAGTDTVLAEIEGTVGGTLATSVQVSSVDIKIYSTGYLPVIIEGVDTSSGDVTIPIQQRLDRFYSNP